MKLVPITNPSEELVGCTPNNLNDPSCLTVVFNVLTNELHCYTPMIPYVKRSAIKNNTSYQLFLRTTNGNAFTDITCSNSNLCIVNYSKDLTPSIVSISPQYFYFGQHIQFRIIPITFNEGIEVKKIGNYSINHALSFDISLIRLHKVFPILISPERA